MNIKTQKISKAVVLIIIIILFAMPSVLLAEGSKYGGGKKDKKDTLLIKDRQDTLIIIKEKNNQILQPGKKNHKDFLLNCDISLNWQTVGRDDRVFVNEHFDIRADFRNIGGVKCASFDIKLLRSDSNGPWRAVENEPEKRMRILASGQRVPVSWTDRVDRAGDHKYKIAYNPGVYFVDNEPNPIDENLGNHTSILKVKAFFRARAAD